MANEKQLIDPNEFWKRLNKRGYDFFTVPDGRVGYSVSTIADVLWRTKSEDAVEVVRCKDCKWYRIAPNDNVPYCCHESGYCGEYMGGLFFCACGERKDNAD